MKKKILSGALSLALLFSMVFAGNAMAAADGRFVVKGPEGQVSSGEEFTVTVALENNPGFCALQFYLSVDDAQAECIGIQPGPLLDDMLLATNVNDNGKAALSAAGLEPSAGDGLLASFRFRAKKAGTPALPLSVVELLSSEGAKLSYTIVQATVSPEETTPPKPPVTPGRPAGGKEEQTVPSEEPSIPQYSDVLTHWGKPYIEKASQLGLFRGYPDGSFRPEEAIRRGQFVTVLWRLAGSPEADMTRHPFTDIGTQSKEFQTAIAWAYGQGYVKGMSDTAFVPDGYLTREEAITILYRCSGEETGMEAMFSQIYDEAFVDSAALKGWAREAAYWGIYHELLQGMGNGYLLPQGHLTRAQAAKIMVVYVEKIRNGGKA